MVPGGRFRESYYWDTYWIVLGLIASDMLDTAEDTLETFALVLQEHGFIPNGLRQYYLNRSQPPFFFLMLKKVAEAHAKKGNPERALQLERKHFDTLRGEHEYWESTHSVQVEVAGKSFKLNQYRASTTTPRPESYREDLATVSALSSEERERVLRCLSSMAESGWDFSSRWLEDPDSLASTVMDKVVPSDLNALLGLQESYLATLSSNFGHD
jgi:alpha,alpha-trehalase